MEREKSLASSKIRTNGHLMGRGVHSTAAKKTAAQRLRLGLGGIQTSITCIA